MAVTAAMDVEKRIAEHISLTVSPTPILSHFSVVTLIDPEVPTSGRWLCTGWSLQLDGSDMSLELRSV